MTLPEYLDKKKNIQKDILDYLDEGNEESYNNLIKLLDELKFDENKNELKSILQLINAISANHHRSTDFFDKIEKILSNYKSIIKQTLSNAEVFNIFCRNKRILLFLLQEDLITVDNLLQLTDDYIVYFYPEIQKKIDWSRKRKIQSGYNKTINKLKPEEFNEKRKIGENDSYVCTLIRNDLIDEFVSYVHKTNLPLSSQITPSIFETNAFLLNNHSHLFFVEEVPSLIEYAAFFGSIQIFQYLRINNVKLKPSLWIYAIHSNNAELIHMLEEYRVFPVETMFPTQQNYYYRHKDDENNENNFKSVWEANSFKTTMIEAIKCHHNNIYEYIMNQTSTEQKKDFLFFVNRIEKDNTDTDVLFSKFQYFNYLCFPEDISNDLLFFYACKYDYASLVKFILEKTDVDINVSVILIIVFCL
ncbi:hypothetical protein M9Y10_033172 [Tritrichomonas musculus]|uniref:DUF3447 domain-containing protein n=1 Tax=Tritrichomonas musculus TaxID=1915356 RepID=A0ABR2GX87_9EUKA